jgi:hypothetical protein
MFFGVILPFWVGFIRLIDMVKANKKPGNTRGKGFEPYARKRNEGYKTLLCGGIRLNRRKASNSAQ